MLGNSWASAQRAQLNQVSYSAKTRWRLHVSILPMIISQDCKTNHSMRNKYEDEKKETSVMTKEEKSQTN
jgi:hypothetical protein